jgi:hypothetical protein
MFFFGMLEHGPRGVGLEDDVAGGDLAGYGVDWAALDDAQIRAHHDNANGIGPLADFEDDVADHPFFSHGPDKLSHVVVEVPNCPMTDEQVDFLDSELSQHEFSKSRTVDSYRLCWVTALQLCRQIFVV